MTNLTRNNIQFFIVVHSIKIIEAFEKAQKYQKLPNYTYLLVGNHSENYTSDKIIQCNTLENNIEEKANFLAYTGWYALVHNLKLLKDIEYTCLLEYDTDVDECFNIDNILSELTNTNTQVWSISSMDVKAGILEKNKFTTGLFTFFKEKNIKEITLNNNVWMTTNNMFFRTNFLKEYITDKFTTDFFEHCGSDKITGHFLERFLSIYCFYKNIKFDVLPNLGLTHRGYDSHNTQGLHFGERGYIQFKIKNNIYE